MKQFLDWIILESEQTTDSIKKEHVERYRIYLIEEKKLKETTINRKLNAIIKYTQIMVTNTDIEVVEVEYLKISQTEDELETLTIEEVTRLRKVFYHINNKRDIAIFEMLLGTGIKVSELVELEVEDIKIYKTKQGHSLIIEIALNPFKKRRLKLESMAEEALIQYMKIRPMLDSKKLFLAQRGPISRSYVNKMLNKYGALASIENVNPNIIRRTYTQELIARGYTREEILQMLGLENDSKSVY